MIDRKQLKEALRALPVHGMHIVELPPGTPKLLNGNAVRNAMREVPAKIRTIQHKDFLYFIKVEQ